MIHDRERDPIHHHPPPKAQANCQTAAGNAQMLMNEWMTLIKGLLLGMFASTPLVATKKPSISLNKHWMIVPATWRRGSTLLRRRNGMNGIKKDPLRRTNELNECNVRCLKRGGIKKWSSDARSKRKKEASCSNEAPLRMNNALHGLIKRPHVLRGKKSSAANMPRWRDIGPTTLTASVNISYSTFY